MVALSSVDTNKWTILLAREWNPVETSSSDTARPLRQRQKRLTEVEVVRMATRYAEGATVYELAAEFGVERRTVATRLRKAGVHMRRQPSSTEQVTEMVRLYESGQSLLKVGQQLGFDAQTVRTRLLERGAAMRDSHGRVRSS